MLYINSSSEHFLHKFFLQLLHIFISKIPAAGKNLKNTGLLPATAKFAVKYRPGR